MKAPPSGCPISKPGGAMRKGFLQGVLDSRVVLSWAAAGMSSANGRLLTWAGTRVAVNSGSCTPCMGHF